MAITESIRFTWPIPAWDADWQKWQEVFQDLITNIDATVFAVMTNSKLIMKELPNVWIQDMGGGDWKLRMAADAVFVSRLHMSNITLTAEDFSLTADSILALTFTPGAVGPQVVAWEAFTQGVDAAGEVIPLGYVDSSYNIIWFNGAELTASGPAQGLFEFPGVGAGGDTVKVSATDTTQNFLSLKLVAGVGISTQILNPAGNEQWEVSAPVANVLTGAGNPNGSQSGVRGQHYWDTTNSLFYINTDGATAWNLL
jgi:hypothetical protein